MNDLELMAVAANAAATINPHNTKSNPRVGCVVVIANKIIATGTHEIFGEAHAEINALRNLIPGCKFESICGGESHPGMDLSGATIYITLEPCVKSIGKKTSACTDLLLKVKPARVVIASLDPHFPGQGVTQLEAAGIKVNVLNTDHHKNLNPWFKFWITQKKPFLTLKIAQSLDGKITPAQTMYESGDRKITGALTQKKVHNLRATHQALLTSTQTVLEDDPLFDVRHVNNLLHPVSAPDIIVIGSREIPNTARLFSVTNRKVHFVQKLEDLVSYCQQQNLASILTECGGTLNTALIETGLVNQIEIFTAPIICGNTAKPSFVKNVDLTRFKLQQQCKIGDDFQLIFN